jgi:hypothetical protein
MQEKAAAARKKRAEEEAANPQLKVERLQRNKDKREAKKAPTTEEKPSNTVGAGSGEAAKPKRASWWATATEEQKEAAKAKLKAAREAKKTKGE